MNSQHDQPPPVPNDKPAVWDLVIKDMQERDQVGRARYGVPLQPHNGRKPLVDLYQELLDAVVYCRQEMIEREAAAPAIELLTEDEIWKIAADGMINAAGGIYNTRVIDFAREVEDSVRAKLRDLPAQSACNYIGMCGCKTPCDAAPTAAESDKPTDCSGDPTSCCDVAHDTIQKAIVALRDAAPISDKAEQAQDELPPLPACYGTVAQLQRADGTDVDGYTAAQMRAYALDYWAKQTAPVRASSDEINAQEIPAEELLAAESRLLSLWNSVHGNSSGAAENPKRQIKSTAYGDDDANAFLTRTDLMKALKTCCKQRDDLRARLDAARPAGAAVEPLKVADIVQAIRAVGKEANERGSMFPQNAGLHRADREAERMTIETLEWYEGNTGCANIKGWPRIADSIDATTEAYANGRGEQYEEDCNVVRLLFENLDDEDSFGDGRINTTRVRELLTHFDLPPPADCDSFGCLAERVNDEREQRIAAVAHRNCAMAKEGK